VATDRDVRFLREEDSPTVEVRDHDILRDPLEPVHFDLVHCRCLLMHLSEPTRALRKMVDALKPGGWLLVEEPDDTAAGPVDLSYPGAHGVAAANRAMLDALNADGVMNPYIGRQLRDLLVPLDLEHVQGEGVSWLHCGGDVAAQLTRATLTLHVQAGRLSPPDAANYERMLGDPSFTFVDSTWFGAQGQRPVSR
jgi:SAM-dependent methyltransferase